jgi:hypothetical protein
MNRYRFPLAVAATSLALVGILAVAGFLTVRSALAMGPWAGGSPWMSGPPWGAGQHFMALPPELQALHDLPAAERFSHFKGVQVKLTDKDNKPLTLSATPGTVTSVNAATLALAGNDGTTKNYTLDGNTMIRGKAIRGGAQATQPALAKDDNVVVISLNDSNTANAVIVGGPEGFGPHRFGR